MKQSVKSFRAFFFLLSRYLGLFRLARAFNRDELLILCYHGFQLRDEANWWPGVFISEEKFKERLKIIERYGFNVLSLDEAIERMYKQKLPKNSLVITVDDGFKSTNNIFRPLVERYQFPSTVYVTSYYSQKGVPIFRLAVQYIFWKTSLSEVSLRNLDWLDNETVKLDLKNKKMTKELVRKCISYGESECDEHKRQEILHQIGQIMGVPYQHIIDSGMLTLMNKEELTECSSSLIDIQLHTHRHRFPVDHDIALGELEDNKKYLSNFSKSDLVHFCYPSGLWDKRHKDILKSFKIKSATTCNLGFNNHATDPYELKRYLDRDDIPVNEFLSEISGYSKWLRSVRGLLFRNLKSMRRILLNINT